MTPATFECDWCDVPAKELRVWPVSFDHICAACFSLHGATGNYADLQLLAHAPAAVSYEVLLAFVEEVRDLRPKVISGRRRDPQDDQDDMIAADVLWDLQKDAEALIGKKVQP